MSRFTEEQIRYAVQQAEAVQYGVALATFYRWRQKYGALTKSELVRPNELERENSRLKKLGAELTLDKPILQDVLAKQAEARAPAGARGPDRISEGRAGGWPRSSHRDRSVRQDPDAPGCGV